MRKLLPLLALWVWPALPQTTHTYRMTWVYDCVSYPVPYYFEWGEYSNGVFTKWDRTTVQSCRGSAWQFIVNGTTTHPISSRTKYYVRAQSRAGVYGPATFHVGSS